MEYFLIFINSSFDQYVFDDQFDRICKYRELNLLYCLELRPI